MRATPFEVAVARLGKRPYPLLEMTLEEAYGELKLLTGQDFGHDYWAWVEYGFRNELFLGPPLYVNYIKNMRGEIAKGSLYWRSRRGALRGLRRFAKVDFGEDLAAWEEWGRENGELPPG